MAADEATVLLSARVLARGEGWRVTEVVCRAGPRDRPFEECHEWTSIAAVLEGAFTYRSVRGRALLAAGSLLLGEGGACFECGHEHGRGDRCVAFQFAPALVEETGAGVPGAGRGGFRHAGIPPLEALLPAFARARMLARDHDPGLAEGAAGGAAGAAEGLALDVLATALALDRGVAEAPCSAHEEARAARAARLIEARYAEPLTIAGLAGDVGLGRRRFAAAFKRAIGVTPYNYLLNRRLTAAAERLGAGDGASVLAIALDVGFGDLSEFTRRFRAKFGRPPAAYRQGFGRPGKGGRAGFGVT
ncbi:MAG TPA: AraC family transcriptional regulator [Polyangiaceae bacterium]|nr:AraC family transcriptional regulator [Polyangiaceae bacterium]